MRCSQSAFTASPASPDADASRQGNAAWSAIAGFALTVAIGMGLLIGGAFVPGTARAPLWLAAAAIDYAGPAWLTRERLRGLQRVAVAHFAEACESQPGDPYNWYHLAIAQLGSNDLAAYRRTCTRMLEHFAQLTPEEDEAHHRSGRRLRPRRHEEPDAVVVDSAYEADPHRPVAFRRCRESHSPPLPMLARITIMATGVPGADFT